jgi:hypothetical protein
MGQYHVLLNLDKKERLDHYALGAGAKLREKAGTYPYTTALVVLLSASNGRGGGDFHDDPNESTSDRVVGRWAGDRIAIIGDYATSDDLPIEDAARLYEESYNWRDISDIVAPYIESELNIKFIDNGYGCVWKSWEDLC